MMWLSTQPHYGVPKLKIMQKRADQVRERHAVTPGPARRVSSGAVFDALTEPLQYRGEFFRGGLLRSLIG